MCFVVQRKKWSLDFSVETNHLALSGLGAKCLAGAQVTQRAPP
jgi:hypothetical protein